MIQQIITYACIFIFIGLSQSVGIGGGPIINIVLTVGLGIQMKQSVPITFLFLIGGSFAAIIKNVKKKNPKSGNPLMNSHLIIMTLPMMLNGSLLGSLLKGYLSELLITVFLTLILVYLIIVVILQYRQQNKKEDKKGQIPQKQNNSRILNIKIQDIKKNIIKTQRFIQLAQDEQKLQQIVKRESTIFHWKKLFIMFQIFSITILCLLLRGKDEKFVSIINLNSCSIISFLMLFIHFLICIGYSLWAFRKAKHLQHQKMCLGYEFKDQSQIITEKERNQSLASGFVAGLLGGALGLGGAIILLPIWMRNGVDKAVASSSAGPLIFLSAAISITIQFLSNSYNQVFFFIFDIGLAFIATFLIKDFLVYLSQKYKLKNMFYILLMGMMVLSLGLMLPFQYKKFNQSQAQFIKVGQFC